MNCSQLYGCFKIVYRQCTFSCPPPLADCVNTLLLGMHLSSLQQFLFPLKVDLIRIAAAAAAAAAAKSLQSCPTLCDPIDGSPPGSPVLGILQARTLEWGAIAFSKYVLLLILFVTKSPIPTIFHPYLLTGLAT